jgi:hypothetical protein
LGELLDAKHRLRAILGDLLDDLKMPANRVT